MQLDDFRTTLLSLPPRSGGEESRTGGCAANTAVSECADRPPTPDPSERASLVSTPPRADARGGRGEKDEFNFQTAHSVIASVSEAIHLATRKCGLLRRFARNDER